MKKFVLQSLESFALTLFLLYIHLAEMNQRADWLPPYLLASAVGVATSVYLWRRGQTLNRLFLGICLYFCSGLIGLLSDWDWLNQLYGDLGAAAMLGWIFATGIYTGLASPLGFLGAPAGYFSTRHSSLVLLLACLLALVAALEFSHTPLFGQWLPFIFLFSTRSLLLRLAQKPLAQRA
jgi:hypothetical protein